MRVSCGNDCARPSAPTRSSCAALRPEKKRACARTLAAALASVRAAPAKALSLLRRLRAHHLLELRELVFLHEDRVLGPGVLPRTHIVAVIAQALLEDRHEVDVDLRMPRNMR